MEAIIIAVDYIKEYETKFGILHLHKVIYEGGEGYYTSKNKDQKFFKINEKAEFSIEEKVRKNGTYNTIKPVRGSNYSNFGKNLKREQSRYSGFAVSYAKDLVISGNLAFKELLPAAEKLFNFMVELDKRLES